MSVGDIPFKNFIPFLLPVLVIKYLSTRKPNKATTKAASKTIEYDYDVVIVGAGIAGASLGYSLGKQGRKVLVIERDLREPDRIVGELLQPGGMNRLYDLGLEWCVEDIDSPVVSGYAVYFQGQSVSCPYPKFNGPVQAGRSFHHGRFVQNLRKAAQEQENVTLKQGVVSRLLEDGERVVGVAFKDESGNIKEARAAFTICCDGVGSGLRRNVSDAKPSAKSHFVALILTDCKLPYPGRGHVVLADPAPILMYPISSTEVRCLIDVPGTLPSVASGAMAEYLRTKVAPQLPKEVQDCFVDAISAGRIRSMPNNELPADRVYQPGVMLLGDSFNCRHPLTGGGMTVALSDVTLISRLLSEVKDLSDTDALEDVCARFSAERKPLASTINILASALYAVFSATEDPALKKMREACFAYFQLGGIAVAGPMSLLSGMNPSTLALIGHFSLVALFGVYRTLAPIPTPAKVVDSFCQIRAAFNVAFPLVRRERLIPGLTGQLPAPSCS